IERHSLGCPLFTATLCHNSSQSDDPLDLRCALNRARKPVGFLDESLGLARFQFRRWVRNLIPSDAQDGIYNRGDLQGTALVSHGDFESVVTQPVPGRIALGPERQPNR